MERITITIEEDLLSAVDALVKKRGYGSRSEIFRDMAREMLAREAIGADWQVDNDRPCYGALTYVYDHHIRELAGRLTDSHHTHHALSVATTHVHLNPENCLEVSILSGTAGELRKFADSVTGQRGVRYGRLHIVPVSESAEVGRISRRSHNHHESPASHHHD